MLFLRTHQRLRKLKRYRQVLAKIVFYGFGEVSEALRPRRRRWGPPGAESGARAAGRPAANLRHLGAGARLRLLFEALGPTWIKLGQFLSLRSDLLPEEITSELEKLLLRAAPLPLERLEPVLTDALGPSWRDLFSSFDAEPIGSASIAQVHRAVTREGRRIVLKIQRPGIEEVIQSDLAILEDLAVLLERALPRMRMFRLVRLIENFGRVLSLELDFNYEARTMALVRESFRKDRTIHIAEVLPELSSRTVLAMEHVEGVLLSDPEGLEAAGVDTRRIAGVGLRYVLAQMFEHGVYNADPHPANFIVRPDGVLAPVDFGMVGVLNEDVRQALVGLLRSFVERDPARLLRVFSGLELLDEEVSQADLANDLGRLITYYRHMPVAQMEVSRMLADLYSVVRRYHIDLPVDLALTLKVLVTLESLGKRLDPEFDFLREAQPFLSKVRARRLRELASRERLYDLAEEAGHLARALPFETYDLLKKARTGRLKLRLDLEDLGDVAREIDRSVNRLAFAVVIAGLLIGSSFVSGSGIGPSLLGLPILGLAGFAVAIVMGIWFLVGTLRSGRL
jgi:ubiquinone biosynthesis protein